MASQAQPVPDARYDVRTIVGGGAVLGGITVAGVVAFALLSRWVGDGPVRTVVQVALVLGGGAIAAFFPAYLVRPRDTDTIAWGALLGLLGALSFTVIDTALLRPVHLYDWTWDAIGGGSGFWYIPVWWMGSAFLAWLGCWVYANAGGRSNAVRAALISIAIALSIWVILGVAGVGPFTAAMAALSFGVGLVLHVALTGMLGRK